MRALVLMIFLASVALAQSPTPPQRPQTFLQLSNELYISALKEATRRGEAISRETLKEHAIALFKYLAGEAPVGHKMVTHIPPDPEGPLLAKRGSLFMWAIAVD